MAIDKERLKQSYSRVNGDFTDKYIMAPLGNLFSRIFVRLPVTPNQITAFWGILLIVCSIAFTFNIYVVSILAGIGWVIGYSLDYTDGTVARYKNIKSRKGPFIDMVNHRVSYLLVMFCIGIGAWSAGEGVFFGITIMPELYIIFGFLAGISMVLIMDYGEIYHDACPEHEIYDGRGAANVEGSFVKNKKLVSIITNLNPLTFTNMMVLLPIFAALNLLSVFIIFYGIFYPIAAVGRYFIYLRIIGNLNL